MSTIDSPWYSFGFEYRGVSVPARFSAEKIREYEAVKRVRRVLEDIDSRPFLPAKLFNILNPLAEVGVST